MFKKMFVLLSVLLLTLVLAGCGGADGGSDAAAAAGKELFDQTLIGDNAGCVTCHSLETDVVIVGPSLADFGHEAEEEGEELGMSAEDFVRESILDPNAEVPEGYPADTMPQNWGELLTAEELDSLVAFLLSL